MEVLSVKKEYQKEIDNIWNDAKYKDHDIIKDVMERGYGVHDEIIKDTILFISINPSFSGENLKKESYFINIEQEGKTFPYFKKFIEIAKEVNTKWSHFDLLFFRETSQKYVDFILKHEIGVKFIAKQLEISKNIIALARPKIIVVSNTKSRYFMKSKKKNGVGTTMGYEFLFDEKIGTHVIINDPVLNGVPVFFTSMLTGQRALDNESYQRLICHI